MSGTTQTSDGLDMRRRRLLFRAWHRGTRETDLLLGRFADAHLRTLDEGEIAMFEALLDAPDPQIFGWLTGAAEVPADYDTPLFARIRAFHSDGAFARP